VLYGSYTSYMKKWYPYRNLANVLNIQFEDMKEVSYEYTIHISI